MATTSVTALEVLIKLPGESRLYTFDFGPLVVPLGLVLVASPVPTVTVSPSGPTVGSPAVVSNTVQVRISGGTDPNDYALLATATDSGGNTLEFVGTLQVRAA